MTCQRMGSTFDTLAAVTWVASIPAPVRIASTRLPLTALPGSTGMSRRSILLVVQASVSGLRQQNPGTNPDDKPTLFVGFLGIYNDPSDLLEFYLDSSNNHPLDPDGNLAWRDEEQIISRVHRGRSWVRWTR